MVGTGVSATRRRRRSVRPNHGIVAHTIVIVPSASAAPMSTGTGFLGLVDRVDEIGGQLPIASPPGAGTADRVTRVTGSGTLASTSRRGSGRRKDQP